MPPQLRKRSRRKEPATCSYMVPFRIPPALSGQTDSSSCLLFKLPPEILVQISQHAQPIDRVMLALSCKRMLAASELFHLRVPDRDHHVSRWSSEPPKPKENRCSCSLTKDLLQRFRPVDSRGRVSRAWSWCVDCNRYLPKRKGYWNGVLRKMNTQDWTDTTYSTWDSDVYWYNSGYKRQCPSCNRRQKLSRER
ncbi:hypothetical protein LCI18_012824 [Fusarium solani-melongenae]|uniref:Uncharacterized protein n=1 Tax=Fusarium solani subsp. cucurbitae TaxID=2747967 RepID=A0ACD3ZKM1_FUSSC|nr:hypothetical protein LCI18_012824 [Fusarium solani-melongenae]